MSARFALVLLCLLVRPAAKSAAKAAAHLE